MIMNECSLVYYNDLLSPTNPSVSLLNVTLLTHSSWSWGNTHTHTSQSCSGPVLVFVDLDWDGNPVVMLRINTAALDRPAERVLRNWISCLGLSSEVEYQSGHLKRKLLVEASGRCGSGRGSQDYRPELILWTSSQSIFVGFFWFLSLMWSRFCAALSGLGNFDWN